MNESFLRGFLAFDDQNFSSQKQAAFTWDTALGIAAGAAGGALLGHLGAAAAIDDPKSEASYKRNNRAKRHAAALGALFGGALGGALTYGGKPRVVLSPEELAAMQAKGYKIDEKGKVTDASGVSKADLRSDTGGPTMVEQPSQWWERLKPLIGW